MREDVNPNMDPETSVLRSLTTQLEAPNRKSGSAAAVNTWDGSKRQEYAKHVKVWAR